MATEELNKGNIKKSDFARHWTLMKAIDADDIIDKMIERGLISIEKSIDFKHKEKKGERMETLLHEVCRKPQSYLDAFIKILGESGYDYIVNKLLEKDADTEMSDSQLLNPSSGGFYGNDKKRSNVGHQKFSDAVAPETDTASGRIVVKEMRTAENEKHESKVEGALQKLVQFTEQQSKTNQEQTDAIGKLTKQVEILQKQSKAQTKQQSQQSQQSEKQHLAVMGKIEKERVKEIRQASESKIKILESKLKFLQTTLDQERERAKNDIKTKNDRIKNLEAEKMKLQHELDLAKKEFENSLKRQDEVLKTLDKSKRNLNKTKKDNDETNSSYPRARNSFLTPMVKSKAQGKGAPEKKN